MLKEKYYGAQRVAVNLPDGYSDFDLVESNCNNGLWQRVPEGQLPTGRYIQVKLLRTEQSE